MRQSFFHDQAESEPMPNLGQQVRDNDRLACAGHSEPEKYGARLWIGGQAEPDPCCTERDRLLVAVGADLIQVFCLRRQDGPDSFIAVQNSQKRASA
jgi:hypothetical protein